MARFLLTVAEAPDRWHRVSVAVATDYTKEEELEGFLRLKAHMEQLAKK